MRARFLKITVAAVVLMIFSMSIAPPVDASNGCFECRLRYFSGGEWFDDWFFVYCAVTEAPGAAYWCYVDANEVCYLAGACEDYVYV